MASVKHPQGGRIFQRGSKWYAGCYVDGIEKVRVAGGKREAWKKLDDLQRERDGQRQYVALSDILLSYRTNLALAAKPKTVSTFDESVRMLEAHFGPTHNVLDLTTHSILRFLKEKAKKRANITANRYVKNLRTALHAAVDDKVIDGLPCKIRLLKEIKRKPKILSVADFKAASSNMQHINARMALWIAYMCGLRHDEIVHLRVCDIEIDLLEPYIAVRAYGGWTPKTHCERNVAINETLKSALTIHFMYHHNFSDRPDAPFLYWGKARPKPYRDLYAQVRQGFQAIGMWRGVEGKTGLHMCRRSFASRLLEQGESLATVKEMGGWSTIEACERYLTSTTAVKVNAVAGLNVWPDDKDADRVAEWPER